MVDEIAKALENGVKKGIAKFDPSKLKLNIEANKLALSSSNFQKVHSIKKGESSRGFIMLGGGMEYIPPKKSLKLNHSIRSRASNIIQDYDSRLLPSVVKKPFDFFPHNKYDFVGKRQPFVRIATGQSTAVVPYAAPFMDKFAADNEIHGPPIPDEYYGPTKKGATGYEAHATAERLNRENRERKENRYRYARLQASRRHAQMENISRQAPWMKSLIQSGVIDKKYIPKISKTIDAISKSPLGAKFLGGMKGMSNPWMAGVQVGLAVTKAMGNTTERKLEATQSFDEEVAIKRTFGGPQDYSYVGRAYNINFMDAAYTQGLKPKEAYLKFQEFQEKWGPATFDMIFAMSDATKSMPGWAKQRIAKDHGLSVQDMRLIDVIAGNASLLKGESISRSKVLQELAVRKTHMKGGLEGYFENELLNLSDSIGTTPGEVQEAADKWFKRQREFERAARHTEGLKEQAEMQKVNGGQASAGNVTVTVTNNIEAASGVDGTAIAKAAEKGTMSALRRMSIDNISPGVLA